MDSDLVSTKIESRLRTAANICSTFSGHSPDDETAMEFAGTAARLRSTADLIHSLAQAVDDQEKDSESEGPSEEVSKVEKVVKPVVVPKVVPSKKDDSSWVEKLAPARINRVNLAPKTGYFEFRTPESLSMLTGGKTWNNSLYTVSYEPTWGTLGYWIVSNTSTGKVEVCVPCAEKELVIYEDGKRNVITGKTMAMNQTMIPCDQFIFTDKGTSVENKFTKDSESHILCYDQDHWIIYSPQWEMLAVRKRSTTKLQVKRNGQCITIE